jgi:hypothetical protein
LPDYRAYPLLGKARTAALRIDFVALTDAEALDQAKRLAAGHKVEVWQGERRVGSVRGSQELLPQL